MSLELWQVDAFTARPFAGNPAAVCLLDRPRPDAWLQSVGAEMNLAETAFLLPEGDLYRLRWFTPTVEMDLCGHATLAAAHVLWESGRLAPAASARFLTRSGELGARRLPGEGGWIELDFPRVDAVPATPPPGLLPALRLPAPPAGVWRVGPDWLVEVAGEEEVRAARPDFARLRAESDRGAAKRGVVVTAPAAAGGGADFVSRFFAPAAGIDEDPVTGSTHCALAPHWAARLGRGELVAHQVSPRGGWLRLRLMDERVGIAGQAVTVLTATLHSAE